jgi:hypothetical protein
MHAVLQRVPGALSTLHHDLNNIPDHTLIDLTVRPPHARSVAACVCQDTLPTLRHQ